MTYLDHAATTPLLPEAQAAMLAAFASTGNPSSAHAAGRASRRTVEDARDAIAAALGVTPGEVVLTSGGTEADNLALKGLFWARRGADARRTRVLVSAVEHHAVLDSADWLRRTQGALVERLPVDAFGRVSRAALEEALADRGDEVALVSVMWANNEVGTVQPVAELAALCAEHGVPLHSDAVQAVGAVPVDAALPGVAALSLSGHKLGGPQGAGALVLRRGVDVTPLLHGGGQERERRSGTTAVALAAGLGAAVSAAVAGRDETAGRIDALRRRLVEGVRERVCDAAVHGHVTARLPGVANIGFPGCDGDALLQLLDAAGVQAAAGAACASGVPEASHVLLAMGLADDEARASVRFSLGRTSTGDDVDALLAVLPDAVERARAARRASRRVPAVTGEVR